MAPPGSDCGEAVTEFAVTEFAASPRSSGAGQHCGQRDLPGIPPRLCTHRGCLETIQATPVPAARPAPTGPGFLEPCVGAAMSTNRGGLSAATEDG